MQLKPGGSLRDISPTLLGVLGLPEPGEMTGRDLRVHEKMTWRRTRPEIPPKQSC